jgi:hypothetical protein
VDLALSKQRRQKAREAEHARERGCGTDATDGSRRLKRSRKTSRKARAMGFVDRTKKESIVVIRVMAKIDVITK